MSGNQVLAHKMADLVRNQLADTLGYPEIRQLQLAVEVIADADTASVTQMQVTAAYITLPVTFCGQQVERDTLLYLGLLAHEVGHLPDLATCLDLLEQAGRQHNGATLQALFNYVEDARIESALLDEPVNSWLTRARELAGAGIQQVATLWDYMAWLRFGYPATPLNLVQPLGGDCGFWRAVCNAMRKLSQGIQGAYAAAEEILQAAYSYSIPIPEPPPTTRQTAAGPRGKPGTGGNPLQGVKVNGGLPNETVNSGLREDVPDLEALRRGQQLARQLRSWWTQSHTRQLAGGVGKYNPRLEASGLPPFTLPLVKQAAPPPRLALFLDTSSSMWSGSDRLHMARIAAVAIMTAVKAAGGRVKVWAFDTGAVYLGDDPLRVVTVEGGGTALHFLDAVAPKIVGWQCLFITDAEINGVPRSWDASRRREASVILITDTPKRPATLSAAKRLGDRVLPASKPEDLPFLTTLAARRCFSGASRV